MAGSKRRSEMGRDKPQLTTTSKGLRVVVQSIYILRNFCGPLRENGPVVAGVRQSPMRIENRNMSGV